ncbi:hypothetical protein [Sphingomonas phyllosphaerae]|uniref:hypothetical protein n=1 Tax=Sphingomonas phyllosphaerae TaxID=257003 RepID=UPI0003FD93ED|nr:hypothetical protein [Sphingomonas phyllosphaerae]
MSPWKTLGLSPGADRKAIRRAYADRLRAMEAEIDPQAFQTLRTARDAALAEVDGSEVPDDHDTLVVNSDIATSEAGSERYENVDLTEIYRLRDMVMGTIPEVDAAAIEEQGRRVLRDPALLDVANADAIETFLAELIYEGTPNSDPLLDGMIAFFKWNAEDSTADQTPLIAWILQRAKDRWFELGLRHQQKRWARLLDDLRTLSGYEWAARASKPSTHKVEFFLIYLNNYHPTTLASFSDDGYRWWRTRIKNRESRGGVFARFDAWQRREAFSAAAHQFGLPPAEDTHATAPMSLVILMLFGLLTAYRSCSERPFPFNQPLADKVERASETNGETFLEGAASLGDQNAGSLPTDGHPQIAATPIPAFSDVDSDLATVLDNVTRGHLVDVAELKQRNPDFYMQAKEDWQAARSAGRSIEDWRAQVARRAMTTFQNALSGPDDQLIIDHARFRASLLRWVAQTGMQQCVDLIEGRPIIEPYDFSSYRGNLLSRAILAPPVTPRGRGGAFAIPRAVSADAAKRSQMSEETFASAIRGKGSATHRCNAEIALLDGATIHGEPGLAMLRDMLGS